MSEYVCWRAAPHERGPGRVHFVDPENPGKTMCGRWTEALGGGKSEQQPNCQVCVQAPKRRADQSERRKQFEVEQARRQAEADDEKRRFDEWYSEYLKTDQWSEKRRAVFERAAWVCEGCGVAPAAHAHHVTYDNVGDELLWQLRAVCHACHQKAHGERMAPWRTEGPSTTRPAAAVSDNTHAPKAALPVFAAVPHPPNGRTGLDVVCEDIGDCKRCKLHIGRTNIVFGVGSPTAEICFVGEGPGDDEDMQGEPFVGRDGQMLAQMVQSMGMQREDVYICNVVKCRPPGNREPEPDEVTACSPFLIRQIRAVAPKVIVTLGQHAAHTLLNVKTPITRLRGTWGTFDGIPLMPTLHPGLLLRDPTRKKVVWEDLKSVLHHLGRSPPYGRVSAA